MRNIITILETFLGGIFSDDMQHSFLGPCGDVSQGWLLSWALLFKHPH